MKKYTVVEKAFHKIKAATGLSDAQKIVNKFVNREETYSMLLVSIANFERKLDLNRKEVKELKDELHGIRSKVDFMEVIEPEDKKEFVSMHRFPVVIAL